MPSEIKTATHNTTNIDTQCRWRHPGTEVRCTSPGVVRADGTQTGYCAEHERHSGASPSSLLSPIPSGGRRVGR